MKKSPTLANIKKGESYDIYIGRKNKLLGLSESKWKNPFPMKKESERETVLKKHMEYMMKHPELIAALGGIGGKGIGLLLLFNKDKGREEMSWT